MFPLLKEIAVSEWTMESNRINTRAISATRPISDYDLVLESSESHQIDPEQSKELAEDLNAAWK